MPQTQCPECGHWITDQEAHESAIARLNRWRTIRAKSDRGFTVMQPYGDLGRSYASAWYPTLSEAEGEVIRRIKLGCYGIPFVDIPAARPTIPPCPFVDAALLDAAIKAGRPQARTLEVITRRGPNGPCNTVISFPISSRRARR